MEYLHDLNPADPGLDHSNGITIQLWVKHARSNPPMPATPFSDVDVETGGGIEISLTDRGATLEASTCISPGCSAFMTASVGYPDDDGWHFVRVVHARSGISLCLDGKHVASVPGDTTSRATRNPPDLGNDLPAGTRNFDGEIDDVRAITGELPCRD
jgi:hypothetical protein